MRKRAFTLIELLVVIAIIAVLMGILMPSLQAVKKQASASVCLSNMKNLSMGWFMYVGDNDNRLVNGRDNSSESWIRVPHDENDKAQSITQTNPEVTDDDEIRGIKKGQLYQYIKATKAYRCPANMTKSKYDLSRIYVSYSIPNCLNGANDDKLHIKNYNKIKRPSEKYVFVETAETRNWNANHSFALGAPEWTTNAWAWWGPMAINHGDSSVLGYCDGHAEKRKWKDQYTIERVDRLLTTGGSQYGIDPPPADQQSDIEFMAAGWAFREHTK